MIEVFLRDVDGQPVFPLSLQVNAVPAKGDHLLYWFSGNPEQGGLGMSAEVAAVRHTFFKAQGDHMVYLIVRNVRTIDIAGKAWPPESPSNSDAVGQSDSPEGRK